MPLNMLKVLAAPVPIVSMSRSSNFRNAPTKSATVIAVMDAIGATIIATENAPLAK